MKMSRSIVLLAAICAPLGCLAQAPGSQGFEAYRILQTRNIFDPDRFPFSNTVVARPRVVEQERRQPDYLTLTGIMVNDGKALAFFSGSRSDFDQVIGVNAQIAGLKLTGITPNAIEANRGGKKISLAIGQTVTLDTSSPAGAAPPPDSAGFNASAAASPPAGDLSPNPNPLPGNLNEVMRRMMERRQQELQ